METRCRHHNPMVQRIAPAVVLFLTISGFAYADEVTDSIDSALEAYGEKDYQGAISDLNYAVAKLQEFVNAKQAELMPEPLEGWQADDVENVGAAMVMMGGGTSMTRRYSKGAEEVEINITANSPWVASMMQMMANPMIMSGNPSMKPYRYKRIKGMKETTPEHTEITLAVAGQIMVKLTGRNLQDEAVLEQYLDRIDFDRIKLTMLQ